MFFQSRATNQFRSTQHSGRCRCWCEVWLKALRATHKLGFPQVAIPSRLTLVVTEVGRCINQDNKHPVVFSMAEISSSTGEPCVSLQMNLFLFCAMCVRPIKISSSASRVGKGRCKKKKKEKGRRPYCLPLRSHSLHLSEPSSYFSPAEDSPIHPDFHAHTRTRTHNSCPALHPF